MISKIAQFFGFGMSREDLDGQTIAELSEENLYLRDLFEHIRSNSLPHGDGGWGFDSGERGDEPEVIATAVDRMFLAWRDSWGTFERLLTVEDERDALAEQNAVLTDEVARLKAEAVLPEELHKDHVPQLAIEARKPRVFDDFHLIHDRLVVKDKQGDYFKIDGGVVWFAFSHSPAEWEHWYSVPGTLHPNEYGPFTEVLPEARTFQRGDIIPDDVKQVRLAGENDVVTRGHDGEFCYNPNSGITWGPSDTSDDSWTDDDFPLTEVLN